MSDRLLRWIFPLVGVWLGACAGSVGSACPCGSDEVCVADRCEPRGHGVGDGSVPSDVNHGGDGATCASRTFPLTETQDLLVVPTGARYMHVKAWGAGGNGEGQCDQTDGGVGGYTEGIFEVQDRTQLIVIVGQRGRAGMNGEERMRFGFGDWGGGGLSGVFRGGDPLTAGERDRALVIAGGGGSAGAPGCHPGGAGNHPLAGGEPTMQGGPGADEVNGGAGGYAGGTGGAKGEAGQGGTGFVADGAIDSKMLNSEPGNTVPPGTNDPDYADAAGTTEKPGRVVIHFVCDKPRVS